MTPDELLKRYELVPDQQDVQITYERQLWQARYTPCGRYLVASGYDATIQRWNLGGDQPVLMPALTGHNGWVQAMALHAEGERLYTADSWGQIACWNYASEQPQQSWQLLKAHEGWIRALTVSGDGRLIATGGNGDVVKVWSAADGSLQQELPHPHRVFSLRFHPDGQSLVSGDLLGKLRQWNLSDGKEVRQLDASRLFADEAVSQGRIQQCGGVRHIEFDATGSKLVCGGQKEPGGGFATGTPCVLVFNWETGDLIREMPMGDNQDGFSYDAAFHPDGFVMATSSAFPGKGHVWFWRPEDEQAFFSSRRLPNGRSLSLHPDGRRIAHLASQSPNGNGRDLKDGEYMGGSALIRVLTFPSTDVA